MPAAGRQQIDYTDELMTSQTFWADNSTVVYDATQVNGASAAILNKAVTFSVSADDTVALAADGDCIVGKLLRIESDGACTVQIDGFTTLPAGNSATCTRGRRQVGALNASSAKGYIRDANTAQAAEMSKMGPFAIANADMTAVVVLFD